MDDCEKKISSFKSDQEILDARGINLTVEEVAGLSTNKYAERVQSLRLNGDDLAFLKGLRRRIKNRLASQNSRRRSMEHLRQLNRELRAVRQCREDALAERRVLVRERDAMRDACVRLRQFCCKVLHERSDPSEVPKLHVERIPTPESPAPPKEQKIVTVTETVTPLISECFQKKLDNKSILECSIEKLVQKSVNHLYKNEKKVTAKTVFISNDVKTSCIRHTSQVADIKQTDLGVDLKGMLKKEDAGVLNLSVKEGRRSHGRKQSAPRRITYVNNYEDHVLDLKIKKELE